MKWNKSGMHILFTTILNSWNDQVWLLNQAEGTKEDSIGLTVAEVLFQSGTETLGIFDKFPLALLESLFTRAECDVASDFVDSI